MQGLDGASCVIGSIERFDFRLLQQRSETMAVQNQNGQGMNQNGQGMNQNGQGMNQTTIQTLNENMQGLNENGQGMDHNGQGMNVDVQHWNWQ